MGDLSRRRALGGGAALLSLVLSVILMLGLFVANAAISTAQTDGDHDKISVKKEAAQGTVNAGDTVTFTITVTLQPFPIDGVVLTDTLPTGISGSWTVSGDGNLATPNCNGTYAPGSTLTCNFGTLGDFGVVGTRVLTVSGQSSAANCPVINNTAHVDAAASEGETLLANNTSTASVNVICRATPTNTAVPTATKTPTATPVPPSPTPTRPNAQIVPTGTTCQQFLAGTASDLNAILYNLRSNGNIGNVAPGVGFYFVSLPGAGTYTISQSDNGTTPAFGVQSVQVTFTNCDVDHSVTPIISNGGATITVSGPRVVRLVFDPNTVVGTHNPSPQPTIVYTYVTSGVVSSTDSVNLTRN